MFQRLVLALLLGTTLTTLASADVDVVVDNFDSYADDTALYGTWGPTNGTGTLTAEVTLTTGGILSSDDTLFPGIQGNAIDHLGSSVNQYGGVINQSTGKNPLFTINPSASQNIVLKTDIYFPNTGNSRMTVGLRNIAGAPDNTAATVNILEMGQWNAAPTVLEVPDTPQTVTGFAYRLINFGAASAPITVQPNWQYFALAPELDRETDLDEITNLGDIGAGWHTFQATISPSQVTFSLDLFRDGKTNLTRDELGAIEIGVGDDGVDSSYTYDILTLPVGFNSLRVGGASGLSSAGGGAAFDNVSLRLVDVVAPAGNADFDNNGLVDGNDFLIWQRNFGLTGAATPMDGDANGDQNVDAADLGFWQTQYGTSPAVVANLAAVPEPASAALLLLSLVGLVGCKRR